MSPTVTALVAVVLYYVGAALFKRAGAGMPPLHGSRPGLLLRTVLRDPIWLTGLFVFTIGMELQIVAFAELPLGIAQPLFASTLLVLLWTGTAFFGEWLTVREWCGLGLFALSTLLVWASVRPEQAGIGSLPPLSPLLATTAAAVLVSVALFVLNGLCPAGRHARPSTGVAYGLASGIALGAGEVAIKGLAIVNAEQGTGPHLLATPYPYLIGLTVPVGLAQAMIAMQRCRMVVCISVCTIAAKTYLLLAGTLLYGGDWPEDPLWGVLRIGAAALAVGAVLLFPRYEPELPDDSGAGPGRSSSPITSRAVSISGRVPPR
ncbi:hypothetical protein GCM10009678_15360 [Actinomadura kijaniata]|uniref:Drug/metabolite transporter (DMT)-like permease n=1 Tax=Actinomadura namibiensis TaxID=182080 RepID=A0A7W3LR37_ACTNM|nr:hypothetical protein [Actinomadura namibiensis]MBA8952702.1 drug/metabolite transporter (DMT)-like permease [Actinomadura namibiensis]